jgi:glycosyltransferase involved in cell wall biosynthesis
MPEQKRIDVYLPDFAGGGIERMHLQLAPFFSKAGFRHRFLVDQAEGELRDSVPASSEVHVLNGRGQARALAALIGYFKKDAPDLLILNLEHQFVTATLAASISRSRHRTVACQHISLAHRIRAGGNKHKLIRPLLPKALSSVDQVVAVSNGVADELRTFAPRTRDKLRTIYNGAFLENFGKPIARELSPGEPIRVLSVGRLTGQKNHELLLRAFQRSTFRRASVLTILGEGPEREALTRLAVDLGIADRVHLPGFVSEPVRYFAEADLFVHSADFEGFGNVLVEALAAGVRVVSTDCPFGPGEILDGGRYGWLCPVGDVTALARAMTEAVESPVDTATLKRRAAKFSVEACAAAYVTVARELVE